MEELEKLLTVEAITEEKYQQEISELKERFEHYQTMIDLLAEHYAHTDYDGMDEKNFEINICIENGELEKADSLILSLFSPIDVLKRNKEAIDKIEHNATQARKMMEKARENMANVLRQQDKDAEHLYQLFTIALANFDNDKALHYIDTRAQLDTTNVQWQIDAGDFIMQYLADYEKADSLFQRALQHALENYGENHELTALAYNSLGTNFYKQADYGRAKEYHQKALDIVERVLGDNHPTVASTLGLIGNVFMEESDYTKAMDYYQKALAIKERIRGENHPDIAVSNRQIGRIFDLQGD